MKVHLYFHGKPRDPHANAIAEDYLRRVSHYAKAEMTEIRNARANPLDKHPSAYTVCLDPAGKRFDSAAFIAILGPLVAHTSGHLLVEDPSIAEYYLPAGSQWERWSGTRNIVLPSGAATGGPSDAAGVVGEGNAGTFALYIQESYFSLVALNFSDTVSLDKAISAALHSNPRYQPVQVVPYGAGPAGPAPGTYVIWRRR